MIISIMHFETENEARAFILGVSVLHDMVLDYAQRSIDISEPEFINGKFTVTVSEEREEE